MSLLTYLLFYAVTALAIHPIHIKERHFYDSVTAEPFFIKGVDYQPGGSSAVTGDTDPLSDADKCIRDIYLFQQLGVNTIRVYSINPDLDHNTCMSLLAKAGIYLVLDVNSPMEGQHLNRYEPWSTYNEGYISHIFQVITEFSGYNNTLAFFAGNEVINDPVSAKASSVYVKAVIRDIKDYMNRSMFMRTIPVGYSAADDLHYRTSLAEYLECCSDTVSDQVDFYGINTYQWCGTQTFHTSGYDKLVRDYMSYTKPIFFSEYGCNEVLPRSFQEVEAIYSSKMSNVFSGGMVYEFAQEPNNYGLIDYDEDGNVMILPDFDSFQKSLAAVEAPKAQTFAKKESYKRAGKGQQYKVCQLKYENLEVGNGLPRSVGISLKGFTKGDQGSFVKLEPEDLTTTKYRVYKSDKSLLTDKPTINEKAEVEEPSGKKGGYIWDNSSSTAYGASILLVLLAYLLHVTI